MNKKTAKKYAIHAISEIVHLIDKERLYCAGESESNIYPPNIKDCYKAKAKLCEYFVNYIKNEILDEFYCNIAGEYNWYD